MKRWIYTAITLVQFGLSNLRRSRVTTWVATSIIVALLWILAGWYQARTGVNKWLQPYRTSLLISVYLDPAISEKPVPEIERFLKTRDDIQQYRFLTPEEAQKEFVKMFPELKDVLASIEHNPLPPIYEIILNPAKVQASTVNDLAQKLEGFREVLSVEYQQWWIRRLTQLMRIVDFGGLALGVILAGMALFTVANVIRLSFYARRDEVAILDLLGAHPLLIRIPFYLEGIFLGLLGGAIAGFLWFLTLKGLIYYLNHVIGDVSLKDIAVEIDPHLILLLIGVGALLGLFGSMIALWMLKMEKVD